MIDQATELRKLVLQSVRRHVAAAGPPPRLIVVTSGKDGVGVTTLAVNLSVGMAEQGARVVVVDADLNRSDAAKLCGLSEHQSVGDVVTARRDIHEVLQRGPAGIQIVPGLAAPEEDAVWTEAAQERLLRQFQMLGKHADVVVLDVGGGANDFIRRCCLAADDVLAVSTSDSQAIMDCYARIKSSYHGTGLAALWLVVNQSDHDAAFNVHQRIDQSCKKFLGFRVENLGAVPHDTSVAESIARGLPFVLAAPSCPASRAVQQLAAELLGRERSGHAAAG